MKDENLERKTVNGTNKKANMAFGIISGLGALFLVTGLGIGVLQPKLPTREYIKKCFYEKMAEKRPICKIEISDLNRDGHPDYVICTQGDYRTDFNDFEPVHAFVGREAADGVTHPLYHILLSERSLPLRGFMERDTIDSSIKDAEFYCERILGDPIKDILVSKQNPDGTFRYEKYYTGWYSTEDSTFRDTVNRELEDLNDRFREYARKHPNQDMTFLTTPNIE